MKRKKVLFFTVFWILTGTAYAMGIPAFAPQASLRMPFLFNPQLQEKFPASAKPAAGKKHSAVLDARIQSLAAEYAISRSVSRSS